MRLDMRALDQMRLVRFTLNYLDYADGSVLIEVGKTKVICSATFQPGVPRFLKGTDSGWLTAEYAMIPSATHERTPREIQKGHPTGRTMEIQRLIGRSLRTCLDLNKLGENTFTLDCDVIQADGGTRTASINGCIVALYLAIERLQARKKIPAGVFKNFIAAISCGIVQENLMLDLSYHEDSHAQSDCNFVMTDDGHFIEVQASAESAPISKKQLSNMLDLAEQYCAQMIKHQKNALGLKS
ncbi:ribonuclease PH [bacterium]|nr:ribonuclease PH [bacterium]NBW58157.1 ribonuclease PH [bacterium]NBX72099.1 ribonuclease PH [bacterium]